MESVTSKPPCNGPFYNFSRQQHELKFHLDERRDDAADIHAIVANHKHIAQIGIDDGRQKRIVALAQLQKQSNRAMYAILKTNRLQLAAGGKVICVEFLKFS